MIAALRKLLPERLPLWLFWLGLVLFVPIVLLLAYLLKDFFRTYILEPLIYTFQIVGLIYDILPQYFWWVGFLLILALLALRSLRIRAIPSGKSKPVEQDQLSQVSAWTHLIDQTDSGSYHSKWILARQIARLLVDIIAHQERLTPGQARLRLQSGQINLPLEIQAYILTGLGVPSHSQFSDLLPLQLSRGESSLDLDPRIILEYLEKRIRTGGLL